jgi:hypothetical protein
MRLAAIALVTLVLLPTVEASPRSGQAVESGVLHAMHARRSDARGVYVLAGGYAGDHKLAESIAQRLARSLRADAIDARTLREVNADLLALHLGELDGGEAMIVHVKSGSLAVSYVGHLGVIRVRGDVAERVVLPHSIIEDFIRIKNVPEQDRERVRLESPHAFVTVRSLGKKPEVEVETIEVPTDKGDRIILANVDVLVKTPLARYVEIVGKAKQPDAAARALKEIGATARVGSAPAAIVIFLD